MNALLHSLSIEPDLKTWGPQGGHHSQLEEYWNKAHARRLASMQNGGVVHNSFQWATEFSQQLEDYRGPQHWTEDFQQQPVDGWANQFTDVYKCRAHTLTYQPASQVLPVEVL